LHITVCDESLLRYLSRLWHTLKKRFFTEPKKVLPPGTREDPFLVSQKNEASYQTTDDKMLANGIFDLKHRDYNQKEFS
jgi:hypothetical protein